MLLRLTASGARSDLRALSAGLMIGPFLWALKAHLVWWLYSARGVYALADIPLLWIPLLAAHDLVLCVVLAAGYRMLFLAERLPSRAARFIITRLLPAGIGLAVICFSIISWKVQQIYGCSLEINHLRAANDWSSMGDSFADYLSGGTVAFLLAGTLVALFGGQVLSRLLERQRWALSRWRVWALTLAAVASFYFLEKSLIKERYTYHVEQNAVLHFVKWFETTPEPVDVPHLLAATPESVTARDAELRLMPSLADGDTATAPGLPVLPRAMGQTSDAAKGMNLLIVLLESTSAVYVDPSTTPNLMKLARGGLTVRNHFTTVCETYKSVYALFYSDYLVDLGGFPRQVYGRPMPQLSLASVLRGNGFATGFFHSGYFRLGDLSFILNGFDTTVSAEDLQPRGAMAWRYGVFEEHTVEAMTRWIRQHKRGRFFGVYSPMFPHHPYYSPERERRFDRDTQLGRYRNALHYADKNIGALVDALDTEGLRDDTLIVVVSDHGQTVSTWPCGHGVNFSLEELRVPLILSNPRRIPGGAQSDLFTQHPDVAPTILSLLGVQPPDEWLGRDLTRQSVPLRTLPVKAEQAKFTGLIDNGLVYRLDEKASRGSLLRIEGEQLVPVADGDTARDLAAALEQRVIAFTPWVRWRHYQRVVPEPDRPLATR